MGFDVLMGSRIAACSISVCTFCEGLDPPEAPRGAVRAARSGPERAQMARAPLMPSRSKLEAEHGTPPWSPQRGCAQGFKHLPHRPGTGC